MSMALKLDYLRSKNTGKYFLSILTISPEAFNLMKLGNFQEKYGCNLSLKLENGFHEQILYF